MIGDIPELKLLEVQSRPFGSGQEYLFLKARSGDLEGIFRPSETSSAVIWISGARGGFDGPSFGIFVTLSYKLASMGINSLRLHYRFPGDFVPCVSDVLLGINFLQQRGIDNIALVGHSFGGAVAIMSGTMSKQVKAVVGLSSQSFGAHRVGDLSPRPLLLIHGERDRNLPVHSSQAIYNNAKEPKELITYKGCGHFLRECHQELHDLLINWLVENLRNRKK